MQVTLLGANPGVASRLEQRLADGGYQVQWVPQVPMDSSELQAAIANSGSVVFCADTTRGTCLEDFLQDHVAALARLLDVLVEHPSVALLHLSSVMAADPATSWYAHSKAAAEELLLQRLGQINPAAKGAVPLHWTILRTPALYGAGEPDLTPFLRMLRRGLVPIPGNANQRLSMLHLDDLAEAVAAWLGGPAACAGGVYHVDDGHVVGYDWGQIAQAVAPGTHWLLPLPKFCMGLVAMLNLRFARLLGYQPLFTPGKLQELRQASWVCDNTEFCTATGWQPKIDLVSGIERLLEA